MRPKPKPRSSLLLVSGLILTLSAGHEARSASYGNDALPSAEVIAFQRMHARLGYADARIAHGPRDCAFYQGRAADGRLRRRPLTNGRGRPLCPPRP